jgi:hypothetical protein
MSVFFLRK